MKKINKIATVFVIINFSIMLSSVNASLSYSKSWTTDEGAEIKIEITPNEIVFQPGSL